jgi:beta-N-acetylhexosaminidase
MTPPPLRRPVAVSALLPIAAVCALVLVAAVSLAACDAGGGVTPTPATESPVRDTDAAGGSQRDADGDTASLAATQTPTLPPRRPRENPRSLRTLTPRQLAGQRVIYSYPGLVPPRRLLAVLRAGEAAGVIFFAENISSRAQIRRVTARLKKAATQSPVKVPLLLMVDQEGGYVRRLPGAPVSSQKTIGLAADPAAAARAAGRAAGLNLRGVGLNVNLGPVLDVARAAGGFIDDARRSYGTDPGLVGRLGAAFIDAQQQTGVAATAKHFPGLGAASSFENTDQGPATIDVPLSALRAVDESPYRPAIGAGLRFVMVSWAVYPALDDRRPAGLSPIVVGEELRGRLGFSGVTVTDSLGVAALSAFGGIGDRAVLATGAGMDLLLCAGRKLSEGTRAVDALTRALERDRLDRPAFLASVRRVQALRSAVD